MPGASKIHALCNRFAATHRQAGAILVGSARKCERRIWPALQDTVAWDFFPSSVLLCPRLFDPAPPVVERLTNGHPRATDTDQNAAELRSAATGRGSP